MILTTALSQKFFYLHPRIPERLESFPGLKQPYLVRQRFLREADSFSEATSHCEAPKLMRQPDLHCNSIIVSEVTPLT